METISTTFKVDRLHQIKSVRRVLEKSNDNMSILSRDVIIGANAYLYTNRNILLTTFINKDSNGKAIATTDTDFGLGSIYAGVNVFGKGDYSLNIGKDNNVNTNYSAAIGTGLIPTTNNGIVIGQYNKIDTRARYLVIGGGTSDKKRKDLVTINTAGVTEINNSDNANGLNTGALRVVGGILSQGTNYFTNITRITQNEDAEETLQKAAADTGALRVTGGIYSGGKNWFANRTVINNADAANSKGTKGALKVAGGIYTGKANYFDSATTITGITKITDTTEADASHGALQIDGGIKVGKCAYVKDLNVTNQATISSTENLLFGSESLASLLSEKAPIATTVQVPSDQKSIGDSSTPVYINNTIATVCSKYAGGTAITLNGTPKGATTASFYAPTTSGSNGYILQAQQNGEPQWVSPTSNDFIVGNAVSARKLTTTSAGSSTRPIYFSNGIPVASTLIRGSSIEPVFFYNGEITACSPYAGGTKITLNGTDKGANIASFYAPTTSGSDQQVLISKGANRSPEWTNASGLAVSSASSATQLATSRNLKVNLANNNAQPFNGTDDATNIGVSGILPVAHGGTGVSTQNWLSHNSEPSLPFTIYHTFNDGAAEESGLTSTYENSCYFVDFPMTKFNNKNFEKNTTLKIETSSSIGWGQGTLCGFVAWNDNKEYTYSTNETTEDDHWAEMTAIKSITNANHLRIFIASNWDSSNSNLKATKIAKRAIFKIDADGTTSVYNPTTKSLKRL